MAPDLPIDTRQLQAILVALGIGLMLGLERERQPAPRAGLRTFALVGLLGALAGLLGERFDSLWPFLISLTLIGVMIIAAYLQNPDPQDAGTTSVAALLLCHMLGFMVWEGEVRLSIMIAVGVTALLYFKTTLRGWATRLTARDWNSILQFSVISLVILPVLPNQNFGPFDALNPYQVWLMVVLISGVSLAGYAALQLVGGRYGAPLVGLFGGLVSSTATTLVFARDARKRPEFAPISALVIVIANLVMLARVAVVCAVLAPGLLWQVLIIATPGLAFGLIALGLQWKTLMTHDGSPVPDTKNPTELRAALTFGALYAAVLLGAAWLSDIAGSAGLYLVALVSGLTDVDAITLSSLRLFSLDRLESIPTVTAIGLAMLSNLAFKTTLAISVGGPGVAKRVLAAMLAVGLGLGGGLTWVGWAAGGMAG
ncbi:MgtC/SapB family protein [Zoogloeaceae bacterium G21618-S1]|nr:MgtC/SapB family protein [Zoogloeaceae bacterium G21618-S1]